MRFRFRGNHPSIPIFPNFLFVFANRYANRIKYSVKTKKRAIAPVLRLLLQQQIVFCKISGKLSFSRKISRKYAHAKKSVIDNKYFRENLANIMSSNYFSKNGRGHFWKNIWRTCCRKFDRIFKKLKAKSTFDNICKQFRHFCLFAQAIFVTLRKKIGAYVKPNFSFQSRLPILHNSQINNNGPYYKSIEVIMNLLNGSCPDLSFSNSLPNLKVRKAYIFPKHGTLHPEYLCVQAGDHMAAPTVEQVIRTNR